jgi:hypothetical protein
MSERMRDMSIYILWAIIGWGTICAAVWWLFLRNVPLPSLDDDSTYGASEGDFGAVLRSREEQAP